MPYVYFKKRNISYPGDRYTYVQVIPDDGVYRMKKPRCSLFAVQGRTQEVSGAV